MRLCKDCKHCEPSRSGYEFATCARRRVVHPVDGEMRFPAGTYGYCSFERENVPWENRCGPSAQFFEAASP